MKFTTKPTWHYPPHLRHDATLPWDIKNSIFCKYSADMEKMQTKGISSAPIFTVQLHVMQRTVLLSEFCLSVRPSVCLSVRCVYCDKTKQRTANILTPHETAITLVFWHQQWLVGDAPFPLKSALKVTHPPSKNADFDRFPLITSQPYEIAKKVQLRRI